MSGQLKIGADGNLLHGPDGHLVNDCGDECCIDCPQGGNCVPTQWTITFSGVSIDNDCIAANGLAVSTSGFLNGTYTVPAVPGNPLVFWTTSTTNALWEADEGGSCVTPPGQPYRILFQNSGGSLTVLVDGGTTAEDIQLFYAVIPTPTNYPCPPMTFTNTLSCGTDGYYYWHGCGGTAVVTAC